MTVAGDLVVRMGMDRARFTAGIDAVKTDIKGFVGNIGSTLAPLAATIGGAFAFKSAIAGAEEARRGQAKLGAVLAATGNAAGVTVGEISTLASELQRVTDFEDDATVAAAGMLAVFTNIKGDVFKDAIKSAQDLASITGQDLDTAIKAVGKALHDPTEGLGALSKAGIKFSEAEEAMIKEMVKVNNLAGAQQLILSKLQHTVGGAAEAMSSPWGKLQNAIGGVADSLGEGLLPIVDAVAKAGRVLADVIGMIPAPILSATVAAAALAFAFHRMAIGQATVLAFAGPAGWAALTASVAAAAATTVLLANSFDDVAEKGKEFKALPGGFEEPIKNIGDIGVDTKVVNLTSEISSLGDELMRLHGMSDIEIKIANATEANAPVEQIAQLRELGKEVEKQQKQKTAFDAFDQVMKNSENQIALLSGRKSEIDLAIEKLASQGVSDAGLEIARSSLMEQKRLEDLKDAKESPELKPVAAAMKGSSAAFSAIQAAVRASEKQNPAKLQQRTNQLLEKTNNLLQENAFEVVAMDVP